MTRVVNIRFDHFTKYIGRGRNGMHFGNPFSHLSGTLAAVHVGSRDEAVKAHRDWLAGTAYQDVEPERRQWILDNLESLRDQTLGCHCKQAGRELSCHGDNYVELLESR